MTYVHRIDRKKDKAERKILDSQERAFWDVHRPVVRARDTVLQDIYCCLLCRWANFDNSQKLSAVLLLNKIRFGVSHFALRAWLG